MEHTAYAPLMKELAEKDILCVLVKMPFHLAVFDINAADGIREQFPEIKSWYIGGHSLGGSMAASYVSKHTEDFEGLVLLAAYSTEDLSDSGLKVLSVYGSEDGVLKSCWIWKLWRTGRRWRGKDFTGRANRGYSREDKKLYQKAVSVK